MLKGVFRSFAGARRNCWYLPRRPRWQHWITTGHLLGRLWLALPTLFLSAAPTSLRADIYIYRGDQAGFLDDSNSWIDSNTGMPGVPGPGDTAHFMDAAAASGNLAVGVLLMDSGLTLTGASFTAGEVDGRLFLQSSSLTVQNAGGLNLAEVHIDSGSQITAQADTSGNVQMQGGAFMAQGNYGPPQAAFPFGGFLNVTSGGSAAILGNALINMGALSVVDGPTSTLSVGDTLSLDNGGFDVQNGGTLSCGAAIVGPDIPAAGGFNNAANVYVTDSGSQWTVKGLLQVGLFATAPGPRAQVAVLNGATLTAQGLDLGVGVQGPADVVAGTGLFGEPPATSGGTMIVNGPIRVGLAAANGATLGINDGSHFQMTSAAPLQMGVMAGSSGRVSVSGPDTVADFGAAPINVGVAGQGVFSVSGANPFTSGPVQIALEATSGQGPQGASGIYVQDPGTSWTIDGPLTVGVAGNGAVSVTTGARLLVSGGTNTLALAAQPGSRGTASVSGAGSKLTGEGNLIIGAGGSGSLAVDNGGELSILGSNIVLGRDQQSSGNLTLSGTTTKYGFGGKLAIGPAGSGTLDIENGFQLDESSDSLRLGEAARSSGTVEVRGAGSLFKSSDGNIGLLGTGNLLMEDGGMLQSSGDMTLGVMAGGTGNATLTGTGASWTMAGSLIAGAQGDPDPSGQQGVGNITLTNGASLVVNGPQFVLGQNAGGIGNLRAAGNGTQLSFAGQILYVGQSGVGDLELTDGAQFGVPSNGGTPSPNTNGVATCVAVSVGGPPGPTNVVGAQAGTIGLVTVSGGNTFWGINGSLIVGQQGTADQVAQGTVLIRDGASVSASGSYVTLGQQAFGRGRLILQGSGSSLAGSATLEIGRHGDGTLELWDGASNSFPSPILGCLPGSSGTLRVMGSSTDNTPSTFESLGSITMGGQSTGNVQVLQGGLLLSSGRAVIGRDGTAYGRVTVSDAGSAWRHASPGSDAGPGLMIVGETGTGSLQITNSGLCQSDTLAIGGQAGGFGLVQVAGLGSKATFKALFLGSEQGSSNAPADSGLGHGVLQISGGGIVEVNPSSGLSAVIEVASPTGGTNQIQLDTGGQLLAPQTTLLLGGVGESLLNLGPGSAVDTAAGIIGSGLGAARVSLQGSGLASAAWSLLSKPGLTNRLVVDGSGPGTLLVQEQAQVLLPPSKAGVIIGAGQSGDLEVQGEGAKLDAFDAPLILGSGSQPGTVTISGGGQVRVGAVNLNGPQGTTLTVKDNGSMLTASQSLLVSSGSSLTVDAKGLVSASGTLSIQHASVTVLGDGDIDVGPQLSFLGQTIARTGFGQLRVFSGTSQTGAATGQTAVTVDRSAVSISQTLSLRSQLVLKKSPPFFDKASLVTVQLINGGITVAPGPTAPPNAVLVNAGGLVTGIGLIVGPSGSAHVLIYRNGGQCDLLPYSFIANPVTPSAPSSLSGQVPVAGLLSTASSIQRPLAASPPSSTNITSTLFIDGDFQQATNGILNVTIIGPNPVIDFGVLGVAGTITLGGKLNLNFANGFAPRRGQSFQLVNASAPPVGKFDSIQVTGLTPDFQYKLSSDNSGSLSLAALNDGVATSPPMLAIQPVNSHQLQISWLDSVTGFSLQSTTNLLQGPWIDVSPASNPLTISPDLPARFFRLKRAGESGTAGQQITIRTGGFELGGFELSWPTNAGYVLQSTTNLNTGPWLSVPIADNPIVIAPTGPFQFFRLMTSATAP
jgi:T5SS/PEP-CTERM-associated repeat protein